MPVTTTVLSTPEFQTPAGETIFAKFGYSAAVRAGDFLYVAGQIGLNEDGTIPETDRDQIDNAFRRMKLIIEEAGGSMTDIVELVSYHVGIANNLTDFMEIKSAWIGDPLPTWTILEVAGLARPQLKIEIKAVAYLGA